MTNIERAEKRITGLIDAAPHPGGDFYRDILEVLQGRREQAELLRQQLAGAVDLLYELAEAVVENQERTGSVYSHRVHDALAAMDAAGYRPSARGQYVTPTDDSTGDAEVLAPEERQ